MLEGTDNILYEAKEDFPGVRFQKQGKENWVLGRAVLDSIHKDDIHYADLLDSSEVLMEHPVSVFTKESNSQSS